jgi:hypothetical protein
MLKDKKEYKTREINALSPPNLRRFVSVNK